MVFVHTERKFYNTPPPSPLDILEPLLKNSLFPFSSLVAFCFTAPRTQIQSPDEVFCSKTGIQVFPQHSAPRPDGQCHVPPLTPSWFLLYFLPSAEGEKRGFPRQFPPWRKHPLGASTV